MVSTNAITEFNKTNVDFLHKAIKEQIVAIITGTGITLHQFRGTYYDYHYRISLELRTTGEGGETKEGQAFLKNMLPQYHPWLGEAVVGPDGNTYEVTGYNTRNTKMPILLSRVDTDGKIKVGKAWFRKCVLIED